MMHRASRAYTGCIMFLALISLAYWIITPVGVDMKFHILRIGELGKELARGTAFPVYMYRDVYSHYGYPLPVFYCSLFLYPFATLVALGIQAITAYKLMIIVCMWVIFAVSYACIRRFPGFESYGFIGAFLYTLQPFLLNELFVRASIGAACVFIFIPIVLLGLYYIIQDNYRLKGVLMLGGGMAGIVSSHVVSTVLIVIALAVLYVAAVQAHIREVRMDGSADRPVSASKYICTTLVSILASALLCLALTAWYVFPMLEQFVNYEFKSQTVTGLAIPSENPLIILIPMHLLTALSKMTHRYLGISEIGGASASMIVFTIYLIVTGRVRNLTKTGRVLLTVYYVMYVSLFIKPLWVLLGGVLGFMQFTWRVYIIISVVGFVFCMITLRTDAAASGEEADKTGTARAQIMITVVSAVYILIFFFGYYAARNLMPSLLENHMGHEITAYEYTSETDDSLYIPTCLDELTLAERPREVIAVSMDGQDIDLQYETDEAAGVVTLTIDDYRSSDDVMIEVPFIMYNGYSAVNTDTGERYSVAPTAEGLVGVNIPVGTRGNITISYTGTVTQRVTYFISLIAFACFIIVCVYAHKQSRKNAVR